jgi:hypothetical protein
MNSANLEFGRVDATLPHGCLLADQGQLFGPQFTRIAFIFVSLKQMIMGSENQYLRFEYAFWANANVTSFIGGVSGLIPVK